MNWELLWTLFYGAVCGYVASRLIGGEGFGLLGNIVVGIMGGFIGRYTVDQLKIPSMHGIAGNFISTVGGALIFIFFLELIKYLIRSNRSPASRRRR
ncbi:MAG: GlsB/YeaQ/YmgE family stress response membrane protein [Saprospiraceae bacterium]|nr:GlsB/YeaQ/YmgE family stress response membrane protein [Saprospiraceae bacterium]